MSRFRGWRSQLLTSTSGTEMKPLPLPGTKATHGTLQCLHGMTHVSRTVVSPANNMQLQRGLLICALDWLANTSSKAGTDVLYKVGSW